MQYRYRYNTNGQKKILFAAGQDGKEQSDPDAGLNGPEHISTPAAMQYINTLCLGKAYF